MLKRIFFGVIITVVTFIGLLHLLTPYIMGDENSAADYFESLNLKYSESFTLINNMNLHAISTGDSLSSNLILFIHGTPGSWMDFKEYLSDSLLLSEFRMIAIDRPGQGLSNYGESMVSISEQVNVFEKFMQQFEYDSLILVGYSYGGPIAEIIASNRELNITKLILLSPSNGAECEPIFWFNRLLNSNLFVSLFPDYIQVANREKMHHSEELKRVEGDLNNTSIPTVHIHSVQDWIAPYACNVAHSRRVIDQSKLEIVTLENAPHFLPNAKMEFVRGYILN